MDQGGGATFRERWVSNEEAMMARHLWPVLAGALTGVLAAGGASAQVADAGGETYGVLCAACHGDAAQGNGPMAEVLAIEPPDLTRLAARNDGVFPMRYVLMRIDGRDAIPAHGSLMPIFGQYFEGVPTTVPDEDGTEVSTSEAAAALARYLEGLQQ